jgi:hypothetical protein
VSLGVVEHVERDLDLFAFHFCTEEGICVSVRIAGSGGHNPVASQATMVADSPDERCKIDGSFDSNQPEAICINLNNSEKRDSLAQRHRRSERSRANRKARPKPLRKGVGQ